MVSWDRPCLSPVTRARGVGVGEGELPRQRSAMLGAPQRIRQVVITGQMTGEGDRSQSTGEHSFKAA